MSFPIVDKRNREIAFGGDTLTDKELIGKVHSAVYHQCQQRGYAAPVDVLMDVKKTFFYYEPDQKVCEEVWSKTVFLLL